MDNGDKPAMARTESLNPNLIAQAEALGQPINHEIHYPGLTKREHFAAMAAQGMISTVPWGMSWTPLEIAENAVDLADALLAALEDKDA